MLKSLPFLIMPLTLTFLSIGANASSYTFYYNEPGNLRVVVKSDARLHAYAKAAKLCFQALTGGKYPGEDRGIDIINICANPSRSTEAM